MTTTSIPAAPFNSRRAIAALTLAAMAGLAAVPGTANACATAAQRARASGAAAQPLSAISALDVGAAALAREAALQRRFWGPTVAAKLYLYDDRDEPNAFAATDGTIRFGKVLLVDHLARHGETAIAGVLAHEWGHRIQMTGGWFGQAKPTVFDELEADALAGYYLARAKGIGWERMRDDRYWEHVDGLGDAKDPSHHGSPGQRLAATYLGVALAKWQAESGRYLDYRALHAALAPRVRRIVAAVR